MCKYCNNIEQSQFLNDSRGYKPGEVIWDREMLAPIDGNAVPATVVVEFQRMLDTAAKRATRLEAVIQRQDQMIGKLSAQIEDLYDVIASLVGEEYAPAFTDDLSAEPVSGPEVLFMGFIEVDDMGNVMLTTTDEVFDETALDEDDYEGLQEYWESIGYDPHG